MSAHDYDENFESTDSGASLTTPTTAGDIKKNAYMVFNGRPCKVVDISFAKTGKHGHAKASITGVDIFNGRKYEDSVPSSHGVEAPIIKRTEWQAIAVDADGYVTLMDQQGTTRSDLKLPDEVEDDKVVAKRLTEGLDNGRDVFVTILASMGIEKIDEAKEA
jgi:translation initiation factor 5A